MKKLIDALKGEDFDLQVSGSVDEAFTTLLTLERTIPSETLRSVALYITYALHQPSEQTAQFDDHPWPLRTTLLPQAKRAVTMLAVFTEFLCHRANKAYLAKFAKTVTNKVYSS